LSLLYRLRPFTTDGTRAQKQPVITNTDPISELCPRAPKAFAKKRPVITDTDPNSELCFSGSDAIAKTHAMS
jgi:hypothetical protein